MRRLVAALAVLTVLTVGCGSTDLAVPSGSAAPPAPADGDGTAGYGGSRDVSVVSVIDGDTLDVSLDGVVETVRLIGINAPERGECFADEATAALERLVAAGPVRLGADTSDRDGYGRLLRYVFVGEEHVNAALVEGGFAIARRYPPDTARADELEAAEERARADEVGMWGPGGCAATGARTEAVRLEVHADAPGDDNTNLNGEWVAIHNDGAGDIDLGGWTLKDESASHRYVFDAATTVPAGGTIRLYTGCGQDTATERYWCNDGSAVWNNSGDTAYLLNRDGKIVTTMSY